VKRALESVLSAGKREKEVLVIGKITWRKGREEDKTNLLILLGTILIFQEGGRDRKEKLTEPILSN
jgi:hypothetical protein